MTFTDFLISDAGLSLTTGLWWAAWIVLFIARVLEARPPRPPQPPAPQP